MGLELPDRRAPRRDERRGGPAHPRRGGASQPVHGGDDARRRAACGGARGLMAILVDTDTRLVVQGLTGSEGRFHGLRNRSHGTNVVAGVTPGKGGQDVDGHSRVRLRRGRGRRDGREHRDGLRPGAVRGGRDVRGGRRRASEPSSASRRACPAHEMLRSARVHPGPRRAHHRAELPWRAVAREGQRRDHPGGDLPRGLDRSRHLAPGR